MIKRLWGRLLFCVLATGCLSDTGRRLNEAEGLLPEHTDSAITVLSGISAQNLGTEGLRARYALLKAMAREGSGHMPKSDSLTQAAFDYYLEHGNAKEKMHAAYCVAGIESAGGRVSEAIVHYLDAYHNAEDLKNRQMKGYICLRLSELFADNYNNEMALDYAEEAVGLFESIGDTLSADYSRLDVARQYYAMRQNPKSERIVDSLLNRVGVYDSAFRYYLFLMKGDLVYSSGDDVDAIQYYNRAEDLGYALPMQGYGRMIMGYYHSGADRQCDSLLEALQVNIQSRVDSIVYYDICRKLADSRGDYDTAYQFMLRLDDIQNREYSRLLSRSTGNVVMTYFSNQYRLEQERLRSQRLLALLVTLALCVVIAFVSAALYRRKRQVVRELSRVEDLTRDVKILKSSKKKMDTMIASLVQDKVWTMTNLSAAYFSWSDDAIKKKEKKNGTYLREDIISDFRKALKELRHDRHFWISIEEMVNQMQDDVVHRLRQDFSGLGIEHVRLKEEDFQLIVLFFAGFSNMSVSFLTDFSDEAVRSRKKRYKKAFVELGERGEEYVKLLMHNGL